MLKILSTFAITLLLLFGISFLLDIPLIYTNWLRYALVILLAVGILAVGIKVMWQFIKELNQEINN